MKKTITINLAGIVFHVEEDAYEVLQKYLGSVKTYFRSVEGGEDILSDIESRIAEIFNGFLNEFKQAITLEDVHSMIRQMGTVEDITGEEESGAGFDPIPPSEEKSATRRLVRDTTNGLIGGVCAGLAAYFEVNPLWFRLGTLALFFGIFLLPSIAGTVVLCYLILWIAMPGQANLENKGSFRKLFRSRKDKILGGVAGGLGAFFGVDPVIVRIVFVVLIALGGGGILLYILFWIITPEAKNLSDEIQMEGNPVTLNTMEEQIRKNVGVQDKKAENVLVKVLMFPFRLLAILIKGLTPLFRFVVDAVRVFAAILLFIIGGAFLFALAVMVAASVGLMQGMESHIQLGEIPLVRIADEISPWLVGFGALAFLVPVLTILLVSLSLMFRRNLINSLMGIVFLGMFLVGSVGFGLLVMPLVQKFSSEGNHVEKREFPAGYQKLSLAFNMMDKEMNRFNPVTLRIRGWDEKFIRLNQRFRANGNGWKDASNNARLATYSVIQQDSSLIFDSNLTLDPNLPFRFQRLDMVMYVPYGQKFTMDPSLAEILEETLSPHGYDPDQMEGNVWQFTPSGLECLTCPAEATPAPAEENDQTKNAEENEKDWE